MFSEKKIYFSVIKYVLLYNYCLLSVISAYNLNVDNAIVFSDPYKRPKNRGSYFGYSVALYSGPYNSNPRVLVGAPRANITNILRAIEPGSVFQCNLNGNCKEWLLDDTDNGNLKDLEYGTQLRDYSWLGGSISVENRFNPRVLVCASRWKWRLHDQAFMNGICYQSSVTSANVFEKAIKKRIKSLTNYNHQSELLADGILPKYGMGQLGFSIHTYSDEPAWDILLGSPGTYSWSGAPVLVYENRFDIFNSIVPTYLQLDTNYLGYSVTSGFYFGNDIRAYAAGAPISNDMKGRVFIFYYNANNLPIKIINSISGTQHGEYFSYSMTSCDIDNSGQDDLIVGAPLWSKIGDEGRIYIFTTKNRKLMELSSTIDGKAMDGRFGSSMVCLGDIDQDGYKDIAVGAPYEEDHGAVYIFNGQSNGLSKKWSQRITGKQFPYTIQGFGVSISEPRDIDGNGYNDIAIGAFKSGHAVLLQAQPVISLSITISNPDKIKLQSNSTSFFIEVCYSYDGFRAPSFLKITKQFKIDPVLGRATVLNLLMNNGTFNKVDMIYFRNNSCENLQIFLSENNKNVVDPIIISASINISSIDNKNTKMPDAFCSSCPVLNKLRSKTEDSIKIPFTVDCGPDNICYSDLTLNVSTNLGNDNRYVIGTSRILNISIDVNNNGEAAYQSEVSIIFPKHLILASIPISCIEDTSNNTNYNVNCDLGNPLMMKNNISLEVDMSQVKSDENHVIIFIEVFTQSERVNSSPLRYNLTIYFDIDADITVAGKAHDESYSFWDDNQKRMKSIRFEHIYEVQKYGVTPIQRSTLAVSIPIRAMTEKKKKMIDIAEIRGTTISRLALSGKLNSYCERKIFDPTGESDYLNNTNDIKETVANESVANFPLKERTLHLNCSNPSVVCIVVYCVLESFSNSSTVAQVTISIDLLLENYDNVMDGKDIIDFVSNGRARITMPEGIVQKIDNKPDFLQVKTTFVGSPIASPVATWIIALSVFLGIVLLILLTFGLIKLGFFNRKKKEELEALKANEDNKQGFVLETTSSTEVLRDN